MRPGNMGALTHPEQDLVSAILDDSHSRVLGAVERGAGPTLSEAGAGFLSMAIEERAWNALRALLETGGDPSVLCPRRGLTPVLHAVQLYESTTPLELFLDHGLDPSGHTEGEPYTCAALMGGCFDALLLLLERGADPHATIPEQYHSVTSLLLRLNYPQVALLTLPYAPYHTADELLLEKALVKVRDEDLKQSWAEEVQKALVRENTITVPVEASPCITLTHLAVKSYAVAPPMEHAS